MPKISIEENNNIRHFGDATEDGRIRVNTRKGDVVNTVIHEMLHVEDFDKSEEQVVRESQRIEGKMNLAEMGKLLLEASQSQDFVEPRKVVHTEAGNVISDNLN